MRSLPRKLSRILDLVRDSVFPVIRDLSRGKTAHRSALEIQLDYFRGFCEKSAAIQGREDRLNVGSSLDMRVMLYDMAQRYEFVTDKTRSIHLYQLGTRV